MSARRALATLAAIIGMTTVLPSIALGEPPLKGDGPTPPPTQYPQNVADAQALAPVGTCANNPALAGCPRVRKVELITENDPGEFGTFAEESWSGYTPLASTAADGPIPPGYGCAHFEKKPYKALYPASGNEVARTHTDHKCRASFAYVETSLCLQRYGSPNAGTWNNLNCDVDSAGGGTQFRTEVQYDCNHPNSTWAYRNDSILYSVRNGTGYIDYGTAYANISNCFN